MSALSSAVARMAGGGASLSPVAAASYALGFKAGLARTLATTSQLHKIADTAGPVEIFRKDYTPFPFTCDHIDLDFNLGETTIVKSTFSLQRAHPGDLVLDAPEDAASMTLQSIAVDDTPLKEGEGYNFITNERGAPALQVASAHLTDNCLLTTEVTVQPHSNLSMSGLYKSGGGKMFTTQCEAEGFRQITYAIDRPDVMSTFTVRVEADKAECPILLSNGDCTAKGDVEGDAGRHYSVWNDPHMKPTYLFALVAGDLGHLHDTFTTMSGKNVDLWIYSEHKNVNQLDHAMESLKRSMIWDEKAFGREYDLGIFNIVAVEDFNMGAMENKSLNIFNTVYVLADPVSATDDRMIAVEAVIGHEYFHNWTGNRVTCKDWFQLTLKEGLTVFREQSFTGDYNSIPIKRIEDVLTLRSHQFTEDSGPMAHPIRPESYIAMDNFYTATIYEKGAEVVRMYQTLLGVEGFRKGTDLYFERHDGQAVTCDDFRAAMSDANDYPDKLQQFERWYTTAGTPEVDAVLKYDAGAEALAITFTQSVPTTPGQATEDKQPLVIPVKLGLLHPETGVEFPLVRVNPSPPPPAGNAADKDVIVLTEAEETFTFSVPGCGPSAPVPSLLREFSAPVRLTVEGQTLDDLALLMGSDTDSFNRWDASQRLGMQILLDIVKQMQANGGSVAGATLDARLVEAARKTLTATDIDPAVQAYTLAFPSEVLLSQELDVIDPTVVHTARNFARQELAVQLEPELLATYAATTVGGDVSYTFSQAEVGRRRLRNACLSLLAAIPDSSSSSRDGGDDGGGGGGGGGSVNEAAVARCLEHFRTANNMTEQAAALRCLVDCDHAARATALSEFESQHTEDSLVMDTWFSIQASSTLPTTLDEVKALEEHPQFSLQNPNKARALVAAFARNAVLFHASDGSGYAYVGDKVRELDGFNPQVAARMTTLFGTWAKYDGDRQELMQAELVKIRDREGVSKETFEIAKRSLAGSKFE